MEQFTGQWLTMSYIHFLWLSGGDLTACWSSWERLSVPGSDHPIFTSSTLVQDHTSNESKLTCWHGYMKIPTAIPVRRESNAPIQIRVQYCFSLVLFPLGTTPKWTKKNVFAANSWVSRPVTFQLQLLAAVVLGQFQKNRMVDLQPSRTEEDGAKRKDF